MEIVNKISFFRLQGFIKNFCPVECDKSILEKYDHINVSHTKKTDSTDAMNYMVVYYYFKRKYKKAIKCCDSLIQSDPNCALYYYNRGTCRVNINKQHDLAITDLDRAIELEQGLFSGYYNRATIYAMHFEYDNAITDYSMAVELKKDDVLSYYNRGQIYCILNNFTSAIADLSKAIELNGDGVNALHDRGEMYFCVGEYTKAVDDMKQAALKNLTYASSYKSMLNRVGIKMNELYENGVSYFNDKNYEKADEYLKKVIEIYPNHNEANALLNEINVIRG